MSVYLAGKIGKNDWRHSVVDGLRGAIDTDYADVPYPTLYINERRHIRYEGPFFVSDDHGCAHGPSTHGNGTSSPCVSDVGDHDCYRVDVAKRCRTGIKHSHHVFAWIDDHTAYGTLVELGIATALKKQIWIYSPSEFIWDELWFASHIATDGRVHHAPGPHEAVRDFLDKIDMGARPL